MSGKDFAQVRSPSREEKKQGSSLLPAVMLVLVIASFAAGYGLAGQFSAAMQPARNAISSVEMNAVEAQLQARTEQVQEQQNMIAKLKEQVSIWKAKAEQDAHSQVGDLHFYNDLPKQSVAPEPIAERAELDAEDHAPAAPEAIKLKQVVASSMQQPDAAQKETPVDAGRSNLSSFRIQVAALRNKADADALQQRLAKKGVRAFVQVVNLGEKGQWFRIYAGPYGSRDEASRQLPSIEALVHAKGLHVYGG